MKEKATNRFLFRHHFHRRWSEIKMSWISAVEEKRSTMTKTDKAPLRHLFIVRVNFLGFLLFNLLEISIMSLMLL